MHTKLRVGVALVVLVALWAGARAAEPGAAEVERAVLEAARPEAPQEESYQRVYEAFSKLVQNVSNNSLGNVRRLVTRLNRLVAGSGAEQQVASAEERLDQVLGRLDQVDRSTDQHTLRQLNDDLGRLIGSLNEAYLRNLRRVVERVNRVVGQPALKVDRPSGLQQAPDRLEDPNMKQPGFPGWDELIVAMDRVQKSLAHFVRSSTRLITSG